MNRLPDDILQDRMARATTALDTAHANLELRDYDGAANRAYYPAFHAARALLVTQGIEAKNHAGVRSLLDREFVKTSKLDRSMSETYHDLFDSRTDADYRDIVEVPLDTAADLTARAREFVQTIQQTLTDGGWLDTGADPESGSDTDG